MTGIVLKISSDTRIARRSASGGGVLLNCFPEEFFLWHKLKTVLMSFAEMITLSDRQAFNNSLWQKRRIKFSRVWAFAIVVHTLLTASVSGSGEQVQKGAALPSRQVVQPTRPVAQTSLGLVTTAGPLNPNLTPMPSARSSHEPGSNDLIYHNIVTNPDGDDIVANADYGFDFPTNAQDAFDSPDYVLGQNAVDYGRGYAFGIAGDPWNSVTMVDGNLEPLEEEIPYFDESSPTKVTAAVGAPAHIPCMVRNLGSKSLSWIRQRDLHVLTVGSFTFANDHRFSAHRDQTTGDWVLVLRKPEPSDSGQYVCSISTKPVMTHSVQLNVVVPSAEMVGGREVFLDHGSTLNLTCLIHYSPSPPEFVLWYHRDKLVNYGGRGGRIEVETVHHDTTTRSSLLVRNATQWHSGRYSCQPANAQHVSILVHVLKSETPAAMQTTTSSACSAADVSFLVMTTATFFIMTVFMSLLKPERIHDAEPISNLTIDTQEKSLKASDHAGTYFSYVLQIKSGKNSHSCMIASLVKSH